MSLNDISVVRLSVLGEIRIVMIVVNISIGASWIWVWKVNEVKAGSRLGLTELQKKLRFLCNRGFLVRS